MRGAGRRPGAAGAVGVGPAAVARSRGWVAPEEILRRSSVLAVVGCSTQPGQGRPRRAGGAAAARATASCPVHLTATEILGERAYRAPGRRPGRHRDRHRRGVPAVARVRRRGRRRRSQRGAKAVWLQLGLVSAEAAGRREAAGLGYVEDACTKVVAAQHGIRAAVA